MIKEKTPVPSLSIEKQTRICVVCDKEFLGYLNHVLCSDVCRKVRRNSQKEKFFEDHPNAMKAYNKNRVSKDPDVWKKKWDSSREKIIDKLGGKCLVCNTTNIYHLHIDYIPTMRGTGKRHPRHERWVLDHLTDFRLLCANHHYELTLTGKIENTNLIQLKYLNIKYSF